MDTKSILKELNSLLFKQRMSRAPNNFIYICHPCAKEALEEVLAKYSGEATVWPSEVCEEGEIIVAPRDTPNGR